MCATTAGWWFKPDFIINDLNINSAVSRPWHDEVVSLAANTPYTVRGYAYAGASRGIIVKLLRHARLGEACA